jgi:hypothetical protein
MQGGQAFGIKKAIGGTLYKFKFLILNIMGIMWQQSIFTYMPIISKVPAIFAFHRLK